MDNVANTNPPGSTGPAKPATPHDTTVKEAPAGGNTAVSHTPLNLGGPSPAGPPAANHAAPGAAAHGPATAAPPASAIPRAPAPQAPIRRPVGVAPAAPAAASARTSGVKTFFTKLHPGAINFLDEQITKWLKENPNIVLKHTNVTTGDIVDKKTEPNIIVTVWF